VCCRVLQCVTVCCSVLQGVAGCCSVMLCGAQCNTLQHTATQWTKETYKRDMFCTQKISIQKTLEKRPISTQNESIYIQKRPICMHIYTKEANVYIKETYIYAKETHISLEKRPISTPKSLYTYKRDPYICTSIQKRPIST